MIHWKLREVEFSRNIGRYECRMENKTVNSNRNQQREDKFYSEYAVEKDQSQYLKYRWFYEKNVLEEPYKEVYEDRIGAQIS